MKDGVGGGGVGGGGGEMGWEGVVWEEQVATAYLGVFPIFFCKFLFQTQEQVSAACLGVFY